MQERRLKLLFANVVGVTLGKYLSEFLIWFNEVTMI